MGTATVEVKGDTARTTADLEGLVVVLRGSFDANGVTRQRGEVLETSDGWPYGRITALVDARYLGLAPYDLLETMVECGCGRKWLNEDAKNTHECPAAKSGRRGARKETETE